MTEAAKKAVRSPIFDLAMQFFILPLTNFYVALMAKSANRNVLALSQDSNRFLHGIDPMYALLCVLL